jgi:hypothetical protein
VKWKVVKKLKEIVISTEERKKERKKERRKEGKKERKKIYIFVIGANVCKLTILKLPARKMLFNRNYSGSVFCWSNLLYNCTLLPQKDKITYTQTTQIISLNKNHTTSDLTVCRHYEFSFTRLSPTLDSSTGCVLCAATFTVYNILRFQSESALVPHYRYSIQHCVQVSAGDDQTWYPVYINGAFPVVKNFITFRALLPSPKTS